MARRSSWCRPAEGTTGALRRHEIPAAASRSRAYEEKDGAIPGEYKVQVSKTIQVNCRRQRQPRRRRSRPLRIWRPRQIHRLQNVRPHRHHSRHRQPRHQARADVEVTGLSGPSEWQRPKTVPLRGRSRRAHPADNRYTLITVISTSWLLTPFVISGGCTFTPFVKMVYVAGCGGAQVLLGFV